MKAGRSSDAGQGEEDTRSRQEGGTAAFILTQTFSPSCFSAHLFTSRSAGFSQTRFLFTLRLPQLFLQMSPSLVKPKVNLASKLTMSSHSFLNHEVQGCGHR